MMKAVLEPLIKWIKLTIRLTLEVMVKNAKD